MPRRSKPTARSHPPLLETLEDRCLLSSTAAGPTLDLSGLAVNTSAYNQHDILVQFRPGSPPAALPGTSLGLSLGLVPGLFEVQLSGSQNVPQALAAYQADPQVLQAQPDYLLSTASVPNDPQFSQQWSLDNTGQQGGTPGADIHATAAWNTTTGNRGITIAVLDSGIDYNHPDLYQNIWINQAEIPHSRLKNLVDVDHDGLITFADLNNSVNQGPGKITDVNHDGVIDAADILAPMVLNGQGQDTGQGGWAFPGNTQDGDTAHPNDFIGWNFVNNTNDPFDDLGHGTAVAGIIGASGNNGVGIAGIDWQASLMPVKFISSQGSGTVGTFISALDYSVAHGARISNNSWNGAINDPFLQLAISNAQSHGDIFVVAAGNSSSNNDSNPVYPASYPLDNIVSVAATDNSDHLAGFSNYGAHSVSLAAPGVNIQSTQPGNSYGSLTGTSVSTPEVTGVLALVWGQHPSWSYQQVIHQVLSTVDPLPSLAGKTISGGRLDAAAAVGAAIITPQVQSASASGPAYNTLDDVRLTFSTAMNPSTLNAASVSLTGPNGQTVPVQVSAVAGSGNTLFDVSFATQTVPGSYSLHVSAAATAASGQALQPYQTSLTLAPSFTFSSSSPTAIPQGSSGIAVSPLVVGQSLVVGQVTVQLNISYPKDSDLDVHLQAPDGTDVVLARRRGGPGANFQGTTFASQAATPVASGPAPLAGVYQPEASLAAFGGKAAQGTWKLWVENWGGSAAGLLNGWSLTITAAPNAVPGTNPPPPPPPPPPTSGSPQVQSASASGPAYNTLDDVRLTFSTAMNPSTLNAASVSLTGPNGQTVPVQVSAVAGSGNTLFDVSFATQTVPGSYSLHVSAAATAASGQALQPYQTSLTLAPSFTFSSSSPTAIPQGSSGIAVSPLVVGQSLVVGQVTVQLNISYPKDSDLDVHLQAPDGTDVVLARRRGGPGANFQGTTFASQAATPVASGPAPLAGVYQPEASLAAFGGKAAQGTWKLWVENWGGSAAGLLNGWSLTITAAPNVPGPQAASLGTAPRPLAIPGETLSPHNLTSEPLSGAAEFQPPFPVPLLHSVDTSIASTTVPPATAPEAGGSNSLRAAPRAAFVQVEARRPDRWRSNTDASSSDTEIN